MADFIERYKALENESAKGSAERNAYHQIVASLRADDPAQALQACIDKAHATVAELEPRFVGPHERFNEYYDTQVALFEQAIKEL